MSLEKKQKEFLDKIQAYLESGAPYGSKEEQGAIFASAYMDASRSSKEDRDAILASIKDAFTGSNSFAQSVDDIAVEINKTGYSFDVISQFIQDYYNSLDPKEMFDEMLSAWPSDTEKPKRPSDEELEANKKKLVETNRILLEGAKEKNLSTAGFTIDFSGKELSGSITPRNFKAFMLDPSAKSNAANKACYEAFLSGDKDKIKAEVEKVYDRYLADENIFDKKYSDKELIENWAKLGNMAVGIGMEYESFQKGLKELGVTIDADKQKRMDTMFTKAYAFCNVNKTKVAYMSTGLSMLGDSKIFRDPKLVSALGKSENSELAKGGKAVKTEKMVAPIGYGGYAKRTVFNNPDDIEIIYDKDGKTYKPNQTGEYGAALMEGKELFYIKKGEMQKHVLSSKEPGNPIDPKEEIKKPKTPKERDELFNAKMQALSDSDEPQALKDIKENVLYNQYKLALICANPKSPSFEMDYKNTLATLAAAVTIQQMAETTEPGPEVLKGLASSDTLKNCAKDLKKSGFVDKLADKFKDNPSEAAEITAKEMFGKVAETEKQMSKAPAKTNDAPKKEAQNGPSI